MKKYLLLLLFIVLCNWLHSQNWEWTKTAGGPASDKTTGIAHDHTGNIFITGYFDSIIVFDSIRLVSAGGTDIFIAKYDADGVLLWAKQVGGQNDDYSTAISTDITGNCYITGFFYIQGTTSTFGTTTITQVGDADVFISKFSAAGNLLWVRNGGGKNEDVSYGIATDVSGNSYITGYFSGTATFGNNKVNSVGYSDVFIAKYDAAGNLVWIKTGGGAYQDEAYAVSTDFAGNCYLTGYFTGNATFSSVQLSSSGYFDTDVLLLKYNPSGMLVWAKRAGGTGNDMGYGIDMTPGAQAMVCGMFQGTKSFGENSLAKTAQNRGFIARFETNGKMSWVRSIEGSNYSEYKKIATDGSGNCYLAGTISGDTCVIGSISLTAEGGKDACIVKYDPKGNLMWVLQGGGTGDDECTSVSSDASGNCVVGGQYSGAATFGKTKVSGWEQQDVFISRIK